ncbi:MAG: CoA transferase [Chloroflexi bacterium]|nr:CoA transferase [Chloroflexota bacterium]
MTVGLLNGFRALDLTDEKGFVCGKILATLGVDVIKIEKPGGDPSRNVPPHCGDAPDAQKSLYWFAFNTDKRSITLNLELSQGQGLFRKLVEKADFVLESFTPGYLVGLGLGYEALKRVNPRIVLTSITHFGQKGPYSHYKGCELVDSAMSGVLEQTGQPDRPPVKEALGSVYFHANTAAALGTLVSHHYREMTGEGQQVDVSIQEVSATRCSTEQVIWDFDRRLRKRSSPRDQTGIYPALGTWPCRDGYILWHLTGGRRGAPANRALSRWMDEERMENPLSQVTDWENLDMVAIAPGTLEAFERAIGKFFLKHTKKEITEEGLKRGIRANVMLDSADVLKNAHLRARNFWAELDHPELGIVLAYPRHFFLCNETENYVRRPAPSPGQNNDEVYAKELGLSGKDIAALKEADII